MALTENKAIKAREALQWELERRFIQGEGGRNIGVLGYARTLEDLQKAESAISGGTSWIEPY